MELLETIGDCSLNILFFIKKLQSKTCMPIVQNTPDVKLTRLSAFLVGSEEMVRSRLSELRSGVCGSALTETGENPRGYGGSRWGGDSQMFTLSVGPPHS